MKKTREQKRAEDAALAQTARVAEYRISIKRAREKIVVETPSDVTKLGQHVGDPLFGNTNALGVLYSALSRVKDARDKFAQEVAWLRRRLEDAERTIAQASTHCSTIVGTSGVDVDIANSMLYVAIESAVEIARLFNVYCPLLHTVTAQKKRALRLSMSVERTDLPALIAGADDAGPLTVWRVRRDGSVMGLGATGAFETATESGPGWQVVNYPTEEAAWFSVATFVGDSI